MKIKSITATEVVVPARAGAVNSPSLFRPLHKLPLGGQPAWSKQFDEIPQCLLRLGGGAGVGGLGELYRDHDWRTVEGIAASLVGRSMGDLCRQDLSKDI